MVDHNRMYVSLGQFSAQLFAYNFIRCQQASLIEMAQVSLNSVAATLKLCVLPVITLSSPDPFQSQQQASNLQIYTTLRSKGVEERILIEKLRRWARNMQTYKEPCWFR